MFSLKGSTRKQPALRRLLHIVLRHTDKAALVVSATVTILVVTNGAQAHLRDTTRAERHAQAYSRLGPRVPVQPDDIVKDGVVIGRDPDPFIRGEMLRHYGVGGP